ncbi:MAG: hypothetical protein F9K23_08505 [Bacteroidetes bacterium]|nr:MAG: hypothetical protein F9K23_08505 [Bacteroidota bacterium]
MNITDIASTQYDDFKGFVAMDFHDATNYHELCKDNGIETDDIFILGIKFSEHTISGIGDRGKLHFTMYGLYKSEAGDNFEAIERYLDANRSVKLIERGGYVSYASLGKYIKRFEVAAFNKGLLDKLSNTNIKLEENSDEE